MKVTGLAIPFVLAIALIVYLEAPLNGFAIWNALPVALGFGALLVARRYGFAEVVGCAVFAATATLLVVLFYLSWLFDWGGTATSSSTSALAFIFVPMWACVFAGIAGALAWGSAKLLVRPRGQA